MMNEETVSKLIAEDMMRLMSHQLTLVHYLRWIHEVKPPELIEYKQLAEEANNAVVISDELVKEMKELSVKISTSMHNWLIEPLIGEHR